MGIGIPHKGGGLSTERPRASHGARREGGGPEGLWIRVGRNQLIQVLRAQAGRPEAVYQDEVLQLNSV